MADSDQQSQLIKAGAILSLPKSRSNQSQKIKGAMGNPFQGLFRVSLTIYRFLIGDGSERLRQPRGLQNRESRFDSGHSRLKSPNRSARCCGGRSRTEVWCKSGLSGSNTSSGILNHSVTSPNGMAAGC